MTDTYISRTLETPSSQKKFTISFWLKNSGAGDGSTRYFWCSYKGSAGDASWLGLNMDGNARLQLTSWYGNINVTLSVDMRGPGAGSA